MSITIINNNSKKEISQRKMEMYDKYSKVINWGRAYPIEFCSRFMGVELLDIQKYAIYNSWFREFILWLECRNAGKALSLDTPIPTPNGYTTMGKLKVGNYVLGADGVPTKITYTSEIFLNHKCYKIEFEDREEIIADSDHLWKIFISRDFRYKSFICNTKTIFDSFEKYNMYIPKKKYDGYKKIVNIVEVPTVPTKCIRVDSKDSLYLCGKKNTVTHNTTQLAIYPMLRSLLIPFHATYLLGNTGDQAKEVYKKIEKISKKEIESFVGSTDLFLNELQINGATGDGFIHNPSSFSLQVFNGSTVNTLNSDITNIKGKRANLVCFDEAGWFSDELFIQAEQFVNQDENFKLGGGIDISLEPKGFPRQLMYASSASDTSSEFYKKFKSFSMEMLMGNQKYFACNFTIDSVLSAKFNGEPYPALISKSKVDKAMNDNREKALRELYNKFSADSHEGQILTRREINQYVKKVPPLLKNDTGNKLFMGAWDSARLNDNSVIGWAQLYNDEKKGWCMNVSNLVSLVDISTKKKTPMILPEQVEKFKELLLGYNGNDKKKMDYENIDSFVCDSGAGGQMVGGISDYMLADWDGKDGSRHKGIIDSSHKANETSKYKFPDAIDIMKLVDPQAHRNEIFNAIGAMVKLGVVNFPAEYDEKDYILTIDDDGKEHIRYLDFDEQVALEQIELMKTEIITMCKYVNGGKVKYDFPPDKRNKMHDDRVFVFGLLCWRLAQLRQGQMVDVNNSDYDFTALYN